MFTTIIIFIIILSILVFAHELGHFVTAKKFGLMPKEFGFGFPPRLGGAYKNQDGKWRWKWGGGPVRGATSTIYSLNWLPLGGFVNIGEEDENVGDDPKHFKNQKPWKRGVILTAGVFMNLVLAAIFFAVGFMVGLPQTLDDIGAGARVEDQNIQIMQVLPDSPAAKAGLKIGDIIFSVAGREFKTHGQLSEFTAAQSGQNLEYIIKRGEDTLNLTITPEPISLNSDIPGIGVSVAETGLVSYSWYRAIWEGIKTTVFLSWYIIAAFAALLKNLFMGQGAAADIAGPIGIAVITGQVAQLGFVYILQFAAILSINLAIINYFPFPALDGGRVLFLIIEKLRGRPVPERIENILHNVGFTLLMLLVLLVTFRDVFKLIK